VIKKKGSMSPVTFHIGNKTKTDVLMFR